MTARLSPQREAEIAALLAAYSNHPDIGFDCCSAHGPADAAQELLAELAAVRAERDEALALAANPHTPRLCLCGHSHLAHTVPAPHSCFAYGQTCPCPQYRQLLPDEAVAQLERNRRAAAELARADEEAAR